MSLDVQIAVWVSGVFRWHKSTAEMSLNPSRKRGGNAAETSRINAAVARVVRRRINVAEKQRINVQGDLNPWRGTPAFHR